MMTMKVKALFLAGCCGCICAGARTVTLAPGTDGNDTPRVAAAVEALEEGDVLAFQPGEYHFHETGTRERYIASSGNDDGVKKFAFPLFGKRGVTVDGGGARLVFHEMVYPFGLLGSTNVVLKGFTACAAMPWWSEFTITEQNDAGFLCAFSTNGIPFTVDNGHIEFHLDFETNSSADQYYSVHALDWCQIHYIYVGDSTASKENLATSYMATDAESRGPWKAFFRYRADPGAIRCPFPNGCRLAVQMGGGRRKGVFFMQDCADVRVADVAIPRAVGMAFVAQLCENLTLERIRIAPENGESVTTSADDVYVINCRGNVVLDGCEISRALDDAVNIHGDYTRAVAVGGRTVTVQVCHQAHVGFFPYRVGDEIDFVKGGALNRSIVGHARIAAFAPPAPGASQAEIVFDRDIPADWNGALLDNVSWIPNVTIRNCDFHDFLHIRLSANGSFLLENNSFVRGLNVVYAHDLIDYWGESGPIRNMVVRNNYCAEMNGAFFLFDCPVAGPVLIESNVVERLNGRPLVDGVGAATVVHRWNGIDDPLDERWNLDGAFNASEAMRANVAGTSANPYVDSRGATWTVGTCPAPGDAVTAMTLRDHSSQMRGWFANPGAAWYENYPKVMVPLVKRQYAGGEDEWLVSGQLMTPNEFFVHPFAFGADRQCAVVRFAAPRDGAYRVVASARDINPGADNGGVACHVMVGPCHLAPARTAFVWEAGNRHDAVALETGFVNLRAGETIDLVVGGGRADYAMVCDATAVLEGIYEGVAEDDPVLSIDLRAEDGEQPGAIVGAVRGRAGWSGQAWTRTVRAEGALVASGVFASRKDATRQTGTSFTLTRKAGPLEVSARGGDALLDVGVISTNAHDVYTFTLTGLPPNKPYTLYLYGRNVVPGEGTARFTCGDAAATPSGVWFAGDVGSAFDMAVLEARSDAKGALTGTFAATSAANPAVFRGLQVVGGGFADYDPFSTSVKFR